MALTKVTTGGITDATIATADIAADAVTAAKIADDAVGAEHIEQLDGNVQFADSAELRLGTGSDLQLYHDATNSHIKNDTNALIIRSDALRCNNNGNTETMIKADADGAVELYHDNAKKLETSAGGIKLNGVENAGAQFQLGANADFQIEHDGSNSYIYNLTNDLVIQNDANVKITAKTGGTQRFRFDSDGLKFGTDTAAANALDDYEEGTYTPADASGNGITYTNDSTARYVKIGMLVYVQFDFTLTNCNNLTTQSAVFTLPLSLGHSYGSGVVGWTTLNKPCQVHIASSGAFLMDNDSDTSIYLKNSQLNNKRFIGSMHYVTTT